jgi:hypothetical protein
MKEENFRASCSLGNMNQRFGERKEWEMITWFLSLLS